MDVQNFHQNLPICQQVRMCHFLIIFLTGVGCFLQKDTIADTNFIYFQDKLDLPDPF